MCTKEARTIQFSSIIVTPVSLFLLFFGIEDGQYFIAHHVKLSTITHELYTKMFCDQKFQV